MKAEAPVADWIERTKHFERLRKDVSSGVPPDILQSAAKRLAWCALVVAGVLVVNLVQLIVFPVFGRMDSAHLWPIEALFVVAIVVSGVVYLLAWSSRIRARHKLTIGLAFEVALAFWFGVIISSMTPEYLFPGAGVSEICLIILAFPFLVPNTPRRTITVALIAATMDPLGYWLNDWIGRPVPPVEEMLIAYSWNYICAFVSVVPAIEFRRLIREVGAARKMGAYQLIERLGAGAMGEVWRGKHSQLSREAAIKIIQPDKLEGSIEAAAKAIARFEREAGATAALESPHSIQLYDFGITEDGTFYYVMELLQGLDLNNLVLEHGPVPCERVAHVLMQACHSLGDAHDRGLIHRDVKPANLFVCRRSREADFVKVLDFGLVSLGREVADDGEEVEEDALADASPQGVRLTRAGAVVGTPAFMAPEMVKKDQPIDGRSDVYSLGCVAYWLMTGRFVFEAQTPKEMLKAHMEQAPKPPSSVTTNPIHPEIERITMRCLAKKVEDRPSTAWALRDELRETGLAQPWVASGSADWWDKNVGGAAA